MICICGNDSALKIVCSYAHAGSQLKLVCEKQHFTYKFKDPILHQEKIFQDKKYMFIRVYFFYQ